MLPSRFLELRASRAFSSYQFDCFVASLLASMTAERFAAYCVVLATAACVFWSAVDALSALSLTFRRFTTRPCSPSPSEPEEKSESDCGGGGGATFRGAAFAARFLNLTTGASMPGVSWVAEVRDVGHVGVRHREAAQLWLINSTSRDGVRDAGRGVMRCASCLGCSNRTRKQPLGPRHYHDSLAV